MKLALCLPRHSKFVYFTDTGTQNLCISQTQTLKPWWTLTLLTVWLLQRNPPIKVRDLFEEIKDGVVLLSLLEVLSGDKLVSASSSSASVSLCASFVKDTVGSVNHWVWQGIGHVFAWVRLPRVTFVCPSHSGWTDRQTGAGRLTDQRRLTGVVECLKQTSKQAAKMGIPWSTNTAPFTLPAFLASPPPLPPTPTHTLLSWR